MAATLIESPPARERTDDSIDWPPADPTMLIRTTTSIGSYGWRWRLFLRGQIPKMPSPNREPAGK